MAKPGINKSELAAVCIITAAVLISYSNALSSGFVYDDISLVVDDPRLTSWDNLYLIFTSGYWFDSPTGSGLYRPLSVSSFLVEHMLAGNNPFLHHLDNILLHLLCALLVYAITKFVFKDRLTPIFAAVVFAVHPVHTEAVAWVSGRAELLSVFFMLLAFWLFLRKPAGKASLALSCAVYFVGLLSKETAVVLPGLIGAYILFIEPAADGISGRIRRLSVLLSYLAVFVLFMLIRLGAIGVLGPSGAERTLLNQTKYHVFLIMSEALFHYMRLGFLPFNLSMDYLYRHAPSFFYWRVMLPVIITAAFFALTKPILRASRGSYFAALWFYICLLPVSNIIPIGIIMSERAMYAPSAGVCMLIGAMFSGAYALNPGHAGRWYRTAVAVIFALVVMMFAAGTLHRNPFWGDEYAMEERIIEISKKNVRLFPDYSHYYDMLADAYIRHGNFGPDAEQAALTSIMLDKGNYYGHYYLAIIYMQQGRSLEALREAKTAVGIEHPPNIYTLLGTIYYTLGRYEDADKAQVEAIRLRPGFGQYYLNRGYVRLMMGDAGLALWLFQKAGELDPGLAYAFIEEGRLLIQKGDYGSAAARLEHAVSISPDNAETHYLLAVAYSNSGRVEAARKEANESLRLSPDNPEALRLLETLGG